MLKGCSVDAEGKQNSSFNAFTAFNVNGGSKKDWRRWKIQHNAFSNNLLHSFR
jgi:hypothetical protein